MKDKLNGYLNGMQVLCWGYIQDQMISTVMQSYKANQIIGPHQMGWLLRGCLGATVLAVSITSHNVRIHTCPKHEARCDYQGWNRGHVSLYGQACVIPQQEPHCQLLEPQWDSPSSSEWAAAGARRSYPFPLGSAVDHAQREGSNKYAALVEQIHFDRGAHWRLLSKAPQKLWVK